MSKTQGRRQRLGILGLLLPGILFVCPCGFAQNLDLDVSQYAHTAWKIRDGFVPGIIYAIAQTPDGYLWLGTEFGLYRFDGVHAVPWQSPAGQQLPSTVVQKLMVSRDGTLWIGTSKGLASWRDGRLTRYSEIADHGIAALLEDHKGTVWIGEWAGAPPNKLCAIRKGAVECYGADGGLGWGALSLFEDSKGNLWVGGGAPSKFGFWRWKPGAPRFYSRANGAPANCFAEDPYRGLMVGTSQGLMRLVDEKLEALPDALPRSMPSRSVYKFQRDREGGLWIGTFGGGLAHLRHGRTDVFTQSDGLSGNTASFFFEDREGSLWVATTGGLDRFRSFAIPSWSTAQGLAVWAGAAVLAGKDGAIWVGSVNGLTKLYKGDVKVYRQKSGGAKSLGSQIQEKIDTRLPEKFYSLFQDHNGHVWTSSPGGLGYFDGEQYHPIPPFGTRIVFSLAEDSAGNLWVLDQENGLFRLRDGKATQHIPGDTLGHKGRGQSLAVDQIRGGLWIGFGDGGVVYLKDGQVRTSYSVSDGLGQGEVADLRFGPRGTLWAATAGGLSRIQDGRVATLTSKNGLPCDKVHWSIEDNEHFSWLYMPCGLVRIAPSDLDAWASDRKHKVRPDVFDVSDGVRTSANFTGFYPQTSRAPNGKIWFGGMDGVGMIDPKHLPFNPIPPPVHVEQVIADRKRYEVPSGATGSLPLPALTRDLQIDYTALSLAVPEKVQFRYKLENYDSDWQDAGNRRQAFYTNLPPKKYTFRVKACNNSGVWNEAGAFLDFSVAPAYYQTWWFRLSLVAAFLGALWVLYQLRLQQLAREFNAGVEARVNERTRIARELHDSLLQGFQGMMFRLQAVRDLLPEQPSEAMGALDIALERGDKAIAEGRDTVSDLREPIIGDKDVAAALTALGEELAAQSNNGAVPCVRVLVEGAQRELNPMARDEIYRIAREALRNAFSHAKARKIEAEITYGDSEFLLNVRDDGIGIAAEVADRGSRAGHWGLPGMRERAKGFGGKLEVWSELGAGTEIELSVPAAIAYGKFDVRRRFWSWRKKIGESDGQQS